MDLRIDHVHSVAVDPDSRIDFDTRVLGFDLLRRVEFGIDDVRKKLAYVSKGDKLINLVKLHDGNNPPGGSGTGSWPFALRVGDMAELEGKGLAATNEDPCGLAMELREWPGDGLHNGTLAAGARRRGADSLGASSSVRL
jgi:hypothetical protein